MSRPNAALRTALLVACALLSTTLAHAQYRASIQGVVTDPQGAVVPDATVTLTNQETNQVSTTTTDAAGLYNFNALPPSRYTMKVEKSGFKHPEYMAAVFKTRTGMTPRQFRGRHQPAVSDGGDAGGEPVGLASS